MIYTIKSISDKRPRRTSLTQLMAMARKRYRSPYHWLPIPFFDEERSVWGRTTRTKTSRHGHIYGKYIIRRGNQQAQSGHKAGFSITYSPHGVEYMKRCWEKMGCKVITGRKS